MIGNERDISFKILKLTQKTFLADITKDFNFPLSISLRIIRYESFREAILIIKNIRSLCIYRQISQNYLNVFA